MPFAIGAVLALLLFLLIKSLSVGVHLSDTNVYIAIADAINRGSVLYKDIFFTNAPGYPYMARAYLWLSGGDVERFYAAAVFETALTGLLIFAILSQRKLHPGWCLIGMLTYLSSFIVLATTDHATGIHTAVLFLIAGWYAMERARPLAAGVLFGCAVLTKAYTAPAVGGLLMHALLENKTRGGMSLLACVAASSVLLAPTLISAPQSSFSQTFGYSLSRPPWFGQGTNRVILLTS